MVPFECIDATHYQVRGPLTFGTVMRVRKLSQGVIQSGCSLRFDLSEVTRVDSAGCALLLDWHRQACRQQAQVCYDHMPDTLVAMSQLAGVDKILGQK